jgi:hypothetical protein
MAVVTAGGFALVQRLRSRRRAAAPAVLPAAPAALPAAPAVLPAGPVPALITP